MPGHKDKSPKKGKITDIFPQLTIDHSPAPPIAPVIDEASVTTMQSKSERLRNTISKSWPPKFTMGKEEMSLTITMGDVYRVYSTDQDPKKLFNKAVEWISSVQTAPGTGSPNDDNRTATIEKQIKDSIIRAIFGSNQIERAGLGLEDTLKICQMILDGEDVENIDERTPEYERRLLKLYGKQEKSDYKTLPLKSFIRGRREVVNHAKAFQLFIHWVIVLDLPFSEQLIRNAHQVLCEDTPIHHQDGKVTEGKEYAGQYRTVHVGAGNTMFTPPSFVAKKMKELVEGLNADIETIKATKKVDPFTLATKYSMALVMIHPFQDGNGRMCRMLLNVILCKFAGVVVPIGESVEDRGEYMGIKQRASKDATDHGEYAVFVLNKAESRLRAIKKKLGGKK